MSWSVVATGKADAVKRFLASQFENCKRQTANIPHEQKSVELIEQIVNDQLDYLMSMGSAKAVSVSASGSAYKSGNEGSTQTKMEVTPIYNFVE